MAATGGDPELLFKVDVPYLWTLGPSGIWIAALRPEGTTLELWEFSTKSFRTVGRLPDETQGEVSVSVDERVLVYVQMGLRGPRPLLCRRVPLMEVRAMIQSP